MRKITFVDGDRLERLIDEHMPNFWTDLSLETGEYLANLRVRNDELDRNSNLLPIIGDNFYIEQDIYERAKLQYKKLYKPRKVDIHKTIDREKLIFIEGGMGTGKSKLLRHLVSYYTTPEAYTEKHLLPIPITYKQLFDEYDQDIRKVIEDQVAVELRKELSDQITYLLLIDAIDEKKLNADKQVNALESLFTNIYKEPNVKAIITSRFIDGFKQSKGLARYTIHPLSLNKTIKFLETLCKGLNIKNRIIEDLKKSSLFKELPKSPIAVILLAKLINENSEDIPSNMTELYSKYSELMLGR